MRARIYPVLVVLASLGLLLFSVPRLQKGMNDFPADGVVDWSGAVMWFRGQSPYTPEGLRQLGFSSYGHPPTTSFWFLPLAHLEKTKFSPVLGFFVMMILLAHLLTLALELRVPRPHLHTLLVFALVMASPWFGLHVALAQISEIIAFFYLLAWLQLRRGRDLEAGMALGLATTLKLFPGLVLVFFLIARRPRVILGSLISYGVVALVMSVRYGFASWYLFFALQGKTADGWAARLENGSLWGIVLRLFYPGCVGTGPVVWSISLIVMALGGALVALAWRQSRATLGRPRSPDLPFVWFTLVSVFVNPWLWEHYLVLYLLPVAVLAVALRRAWPTLTRREQIVALGTLLLAVWLMQYATGIEAFNGVRSAYKAAPTSLHHFKLHLLETVHWIIGPLLQVSVLVLLRAAKRVPGLFDQLALS